MARLFTYLLILLLVLAGGHRAAAKDTGGLEHAGAGVVKKIVDGDTLILDDGREIRLVGIQAPKLPLGRAGFAEWPLAREAKAALSDLALGRRLTVSHGGRRTDRHGRLLAHLHDRSGRWIQGALITQGMARVYSFADNRALVEEMLGLETAARAAGRGIWADPFYDVIHQRDALRYLTTFQLIEGRVAKVAVVRGRAYLNFAKLAHRFHHLPRAEEPQAVQEGGRRCEAIRGPHGAGQGLAQILQRAVGRGHPSGTDRGHRRVRGGAHRPPLKPRPLNLAPYASMVSVMPPSGSKQAAMSLPSKPQPPSILSVQSVN